MNVPLSFPPLPGEAGAPERRSYVNIQEALMIDDLTERTLYVKWTFWSDMRWMVSVWLI